MGDFLKSAFDYFGNSNKSKTTSNELVGNNIEIGNHMFKVLNTIAEGGFSVVFEAQNVKTNKCYAIKRIISQDVQTNTEVMQEINILKKLSGHSNIIKLLTAASIGQEKQRQMGTEFLIVTEYCRGGQLIDLMMQRRKPFPTTVTIQIFCHVCKAIEHMHNQNPPLIHRDLKVENLLINDHSVIKLCDFGSSTVDRHYPDNSWNALKRGEVQEEIEQHTTPMYRPPEMLDLYQNFPIDEACDIWALGCVLFYLYTNKHPFEDFAKLAILNAKYSIPSNIEMEEGITGLIYQMLLIDPRQRPRITEILADIRVQASNKSIPLKPSVLFDKESLSHLPALSLLPDDDTQSSITPTRNAASERPKKPTPPVPSSTQNYKQPSVSPSHVSSPPPAQSPVTPPIMQPQHQQNDGGKKMFGMLKEGAGHFMKNIKEASNKVMEQVSSSMNKSELDLTYITSRVIIMPTPGEVGIDTITKDRLDDVHTFLEFRHSNQYFIYNLSLRTIKADRFRDRVLQVGATDSTKTPQLSSLIQIVHHQYDWLSQDTKNVVVVMCQDGGALSIMSVASLLCWCQLLDHSGPAFEIVKSRRRQMNTRLSPSQSRYIDYVCRLVRSIDKRTKDGDNIMQLPNTTLDNFDTLPNIPHDQFIKLTGIILQPVPIFNRSKTGIRPLIEIFCNYKLVYSNIAQYEDLKVFHTDENFARIPIPNIMVYGDLNVIVSHTRSNIVNKVKITSFKVCEFQVFTGYIERNCKEINFTKNQLDHIDPDADKYPRQFSVKLQLSVSNLSYSKKEMDDKEDEAYKMVWLNDADIRQYIKQSISGTSSDTDDSRLALFGSREEMHACISSAQVRIPSKPKRPPPSVNHQKEEVKSNNNNIGENKVDKKNAMMAGNFFETLPWENSDSAMNNEDNGSNRNSVAMSFQDANRENMRGSTVEDEQENVYESIDDNVPAENNAIIGDLLGDFGDPGQSADIHVATRHEKKPEPAGMDGLYDFLKAFPEQNKTPQTVYSNIDGGTVTKADVIGDDLLGGDIQPRERSNVSLLLLDDEHHQTSQNAAGNQIYQNDPLDLFGPTPSNNQDKSTIKNTSNTTPNSDWTNLLFSQENNSPQNTLIPNQNNPSNNSVKQASSTNNLLLLGNDLLLGDANNKSTLATNLNTSSVKHSPSFNMNPTLNKGGGQSNVLPLHQQQSLLGNTNHRSGSNLSTMASQIGSNESGLGKREKKISGSDFDIFGSSNISGMGNAGVFTGSGNIGGGTNTTAATKHPTNPPMPPPKPTRKSSGTGMPEKPKDAFRDLLGDFKPQNHSQTGEDSGKSMKEMKRAQRAQTTDPEQMKVEEWIDGRERNIRALLCSLHTILWEGIRWSGVNMAELVTVDQVKRAYKNAIRCVHPDKWNNSSHENLAKLIMIELNDAMTEFEKEKNAAS